MSDREWINMNDSVPTEEQDVWYFFEPFSKVYAGKYLGLCDAGILHGFGSEKGGFSFGPEVQFWMPRMGECEPAPPHPGDKWGPIIEKLARPREVYVLDPPPIYDAAYSKFVKALEKDEP